MSYPINKLSEIAEINPRKPKIEREDEILTSFLPMENVDGESGIVTKFIEHPYSKVRKGYTYFEEGDVIFAKITPCMQNGKHAVVKGLIDGFGFGSTEFHVIRATDRIIPEWIHLFLRRRDILDAAVRTFTGAVGHQRVPASFLENIIIPVPPVSIQRSIVAKLKSQLAEVERSNKGAIAQFTDLPILKAKSLDAIYDFGKYKAVKIGEHAKLQSGYAFKSKHFETSGVKLLRNTNVSPGVIKWGETVYLSESKKDQYEVYNLSLGDVILSLDRPIISSGIKVARLSSNDIPALLVQRVGRFLINKSKLLPEYLYAFMKTNHFISAISGHDQSLGVPHISPGQIEAIEIPLPSLDIQKNIILRTSGIIEYEAITRKALTNTITDYNLLKNKLLATVFEI